MAKEKASSKAKDKIADLNPLGDVAPFDPSEFAKERKSSSAGSDKPVSPLGAPRPVQPIDPDVTNPLLVEARRRIEQLEQELTAERQTRRELERKTY